MPRPGSERPLSDSLSWVKCLLRLLWVVISFSNSQLCLFFLCWGKAISLATQVVPCILCLPVCTNLGKEQGGSRRLYSSPPLVSSLPSWVLIYSCHNGFKSKIVFTPSGRGIKVSLHLWSPCYRPLFSSPTLNSGERLFFVCGKLWKGLWLGIARPSSSPNVLGQSFNGSPLLERVLRDS